LSIILCRRRRYYCDWTFRKPFSRETIPRLDRNTSIFARNRDRDETVCNRFPRCGSAFVVDQWIGRNSAQKLIRIRRPVDVSRLKSKRRFSSLELDWERVRDSRKTFESAPGRKLHRQPEKNDTVNFKGQFTLIIDTLSRELFKLWFHCY